MSEPIIIRDFTSEDGVRHVLKAKFIGRAKVILTDITIHEDRGSQSSFSFGLYPEDLEKIQAEWAAINATYEQH